jgi:hypothetical protein
MAGLAPGYELLTDVPLGTSFQLLAIEANYPVRVALYITSDHRDADAGREIDTIPSGDHGVILDGIFGVSDPIDVPPPLSVKTYLVPPVFGYNGEDFPSSYIPARITMLGDVNSQDNAAVTYTVIPIEAGVL